MIYSMTGFGRGEATSGMIGYQVELKTLNSKSTDIRCKLPDGFVQEEIIMRQIIQDRVRRGRIELLVTDISQAGAIDLPLNEGLIKAYYLKLKKIANDLNEDSSQLLPTILRNQDLLKTSSAQLNEEQMEVLTAALHRAIDNLDQFRLEEGKVLANDLLLRNRNISELLQRVEPFEAPRLDKLRTRLKKNLEEFLQNEKVDHNRYEQEVLFYIEKLDITEEKIRLEQHCKYFEEQVTIESEQSGKVLGFIAQEMGREINTLGSKAQDTDIQQIVVAMKDELEKIKEQIANVL